MTWLDWGCDRWPSRVAICSVETVAWRYGVPGDLENSRARPRRSDGRAWKNWRPGHGLGLEELVARSWFDSVCLRPSSRPGCEAGGPVVGAEGQTRLGPGWVGLGFDLFLARPEEDLVARPGGPDSHRKKILPTQPCLKTPDLVAWFGPDMTLNQRTWFFHLPGLKELSRTAVSLLLCGLPFY